MFKKLKSKLLVAVNNPHVQTVSLILGLFLGITLLVYMLAEHPQGFFFLVFGFIFAYCLYMLYTTLLSMLKDRQKRR